MCPRVCARRGLLPVGYACYTAGGGLRAPRERRGQRDREKWKPYAADIAKVAAPAKVERRAARVGGPPLVTPLRQRLWGAKSPPPTVGVMIEVGL